MDTNHVPEEMKKRYLDRRTKDVAECFSKLDHKDWSYFERLGHQLKGNAASYGYDELGSIAREMEISAHQKDFETLEKHVSQFKQWLQERVTQ